MPKKYKVNKYDAGKIEEIKPKIKMSDMFDGVQDRSKAPNLNKKNSERVSFFKDNKKKKPKSKTKKKKSNY